MENIAVIERMNYLLSNLNLTLPSINKNRAEEEDDEDRMNIIVNFL